MSLLQKFLRKIGRFTISRRKRFHTWKSLHALALIFPLWTGSRIKKAYILQTHHGGWSQREAQFPVSSSFSYLDQLKVPPGWSPAYLNKNSAYLKSCQLSGIIDQIFATFGKYRPNLCNFREISTKSLQLLANLDQISADHVRSQQVLARSAYLGRSRQVSVDLGTFGRILTDFGKSSKSEQISANLAQISAKLNQIST